jgi:hypothetical protein
MINVKEIVTEQVNRIWSENSEKITFNIPPLTIEKIPDSEILFIGINPSLNSSDKIRLQEKKDKSLEYYSLDHKSGNNHKYFKKFQLISEKTNLTWSHYDLLFIRETKQEKVKKLLKDESGIQFLYKQLMISKLVLDKIIDKISPTIFVVNNTLAREFLGKDRPENYDDKQAHWMDYRFQWKEEIGTYIYKNCPFFFTSMLTGQRALDNGSFERLIWHINFVKSKM